MSVASLLAHFQTPVSVIWPDDSIISSSMFIVQSPSDRIHALIDTSAVQMRGTYMKCHVGDVSMKKSSPSVKFCTLILISLIVPLIPSNSGEQR